jgi:hypothetical protein
LVCSVRHPLPARELVPCKVLVSKHLIVMGRVDKNPCNTRPSAPSAPV